MGIKATNRRLPKQQSLFRPSFFSTLITLALLLSGCVTLRDPEASQEYRGDIVGAARNDQTLGQTFTSRRPRLNGVQVWLRSTPDFSQEDQLIVELYHAPGETSPLVKTSFPHGALANAFPLTISFPPQNDPAGQSYYLALKTTGGGVEAFGRREQAYPKGEVLLNGTPQEADLGFRLSYDYDLVAVLGDLGNALDHIWLILPLALILWVPGRLLLYLIESEAGSAKNRWPDPGERAALALGLSMALTPLLMLWTTTLGLRWNRMSALLGGIAFAGALLGVMCRRWKKQQSKTLLRIATIDKSSLALLVIILFSLGVRLAMTRDLAAPAWVDPVHHGTITRLILEQGAFPESYSPYVDTQVASYHPGFHSLVATFVWLSGWELHSGMLLLGQVLNALSVLAVYLFTTTFTENRAAGLVAALITGVFTPMPSYYASWGRYTQLAGLLILPACMAFTKRLIEIKGSKRKEVLSLVIVSSIACAGLFLVHYRVTIFLACLLLAYLLARGLKSLSTKSFWWVIPRAIGLLSLVGAIAILVTLPWWPDFLSAYVLPAIARGKGSVGAFKDFSWNYLTTAYGKQAMILAGLGLAWSIVRARWFGPMLALWVSLLFVLANPGTLHLPIGFGINNTSVEILLFMPISTLGGYLVGCLIRAGNRIIPTRWHIPFHAGLGIVGIALALIGARTLLPILNPITFLFREADEPAITWIQENIPARETILINPFLWGYGIYAGQDGGYWITPLSGRKTLPPPVLYAYGDAETVTHTVETCQQVIEVSKDPQALDNLLETQRIRYVYTGARGGALSAQALQESPLFQLVYSQDGVSIFQRTYP